MEDGAACTLSSATGAVALDDDDGAGCDTDGFGTEAVEVNIAVPAVGGEEPPAADVVEEPDAAGAGADDVAPEADEGDCTMEEAGACEPLVEAATDVSADVGESADGAVAEDDEDKGEEEDDEEDADPPGWASGLKLQAAMPLCTAARRGRRQHVRVL